MSSIEPTLNNHRISELDLMRGCALLGILLMNIIAMAYPLESYSNPNVFYLWVQSIESGTAQSESFLDGAIVNKLLFSLMHIFIDQKMMGLFSLLFGASTLLILSKLKESQRGRQFYFFRNAWLVVFGLVHSIFIFVGDVLLVYGVCAFFLFFFANLTPKKQLSLGIVVYCIPIMMQCLMQLSVFNFSADELLELREIWQPNIDIIQYDIDFILNANYGEYVWNNIGFYETSTELGSIHDWYWNAIFIEAFARAFGMMLIGMAFYQWGVLSCFRQYDKEQRKKYLSIYPILLKYGFFFGFVITLTGLSVNYFSNWDASFSAVGGRVLNHIATPFMVSAYVALIIGWSQMSLKSNLMLSLTNKLQSVGRMAFTNYIMHSVIGFFLFTGVGLGLYAKLNRVELFVVVIIIWLLQLIISEWWLKHYRYGPLEWLWRSLTYLTYFSMKR